LRRTNRRNRLSRQARLVRGTSRAFLRAVHLNVRQLFVKRFVFLFGLFGCVSAFSQSIEEVLARHLEAAGGAERLKAVRASITESVITNDVAARPCIEYAKSGQKLRIEMTFPTGTVIFCYNGTSGWKRAVMPNGEKREVVPLSEREARDMAQDSRFTLSDSLLEYRKHMDHLKGLGHEEIAGHDAFAIEVSDEGVPPIKKYIDTKTYLEIAEDTQDSPNSLPYRVVKEDFRSVDGVTTPFHIMSYKNGRLVIDKKIGKITFLPTLDDRIFETPHD